jgi:hypothetical protein
MIPLSAGIIKRQLIRIPHKTVLLREGVVLSVASLGFLLGIKPTYPFPEYLVVSMLLTAEAIMAVDKLQGEDPLTEKADFVPHKSGQVNFLAEIFPGVS